MSLRVRILLADAFAGLTLVYALIVAALFVAFYFSASVRLAIAHIPAWLGVPSFAWFLGFGVGGGFAESLMWLWMYWDCSHGDTRRPAAELRRWRLAFLLAGWPAAWVYYVRVYHPRLARRAQ